jgi:hypothetical protein
MTCEKCGCDYKEEFEAGSYCFGCGKKDSYLPKGRIMKNEFMPRKLFALEDVDYKTIKRKWGITRKQADRAGWQLAETNAYDKWLYMPVYDEMGKQVYFQCRAWNNQCGKLKYRSSSAPSASVLYKSKMIGQPFKWVAVVEGIPDAVRVGRIMPTAALLGSNTSSEDKIAALKEYGQRFAILLDADVLGKMIDLQYRLGWNAAKIVRIPTGDPTDYTDKDLRYYFKKAGVHINA